MDKTDKIDNVDWKQKYLEEHNKYLEFKKGSIPIQNVINSLKLFSSTIEDMRLIIYKSEIDEYVDSLKRLLKENDCLNWLDKYYDERIKVQDLESKVEIYENITIPRLKNLATEPIKEVLEMLENLPLRITDVMKQEDKYPVVKESELNNIIEYLKNIIKKGE